MKTHVYIPTPKEIWDKLRTWFTNFLNRRVRLDYRINVLQKRIRKLLEELEDGLEKRKGGPIPTGDANRVSINLEQMGVRGLDRPSSHVIRNIQAAMGSDWRVASGAVKTTFRSSRLNKKVEMRTQKLVDLLRKGTSPTQIAEAVIDAALDHAPKKFPEYDSAEDKAGPPGVRFSR